jgi:hypothetical protein
METKFKAAIEEATALGFVQRHKSAGPDGNTDLVAFERRGNEDALFTDMGWAYTASVEDEYESEPEGSISLEVTGTADTLKDAINNARAIVADAAERFRKRADPRPAP